MTTEMENAAMEPQEAQMKNETFDTVTNPVQEQKNARMQSDQGKKRNNRLLMKLGIIGLLSVLLLIPQQFILRMINERYATSSKAETEVSQLWSKAQQVTGPVIHIPDMNNHEKDLHLLPEELHIKGDVKTENRHRGIFDVTVYSADLNIEGSFIIPDLPAFENSSYDTSKAEVLIALNDFRGLTENITLG